MKIFKNYILILFFISTGYLFSQTEENEIVKIDTDINIDSVVVTNVEYIKT
jgi:hypothetical protein